MWYWDRWFYWLGGRGYCWDLQLHSETTNTWRSILVHGSCNCRRRLLGLKHRYWRKEQPWRANTTLDENLFYCPNLGYVRRWHGFLKTFVRYFFFSLAIVSWILDFKNFRVYAHINFCNAVYKSLSEMSFSCCKESNIFDLISRKSNL